MTAATAALAEGLCDAGAPAEVLNLGYGDFVVVHLSDGDEARLYVLDDGSVRACMAMLNDDAESLTFTRPGVDAAVVAFVEEFGDLYEEGE